jgi:hypothetical protein
MPDYDSTEAFVSIDFSTRFPHKYKLLSVRPEPTGLIEMVLLLEEASGAKTEMKRLNVSPSAFERTAAIFTDGLADEYNIEFTEMDLTRVGNESEFERIVSAAGWSVINLQ